MMGDGEGEDKQGKRTYLSICLNFRIRLLRN